MVVFEYTFHYEVNDRKYLQLFDGGSDTEIVSTDPNQVMLLPAPNTSDVPSPSCVTPLYIYICSIKT
jgi:hypothetical protein